MTWNPTSPSSITLSSGDRTATKTTSNAIYRTIMTSHPLPSGSYVEILVSGATSPFMLMGLSTTQAAYSTNSLGWDATGYGYYQDTGTFTHAGVTTAYGASFTTGDVIGIAYRNGKLFFAKNNTWQGSGDPVTEANPAASGIVVPVYAAASLYRANAPAHIATLRPSAATQVYAPPSGYSPPST